MMYTVMLLLSNSVDMSSDPSAQLKTYHQSSINNLILILYYGSYLSILYSFLSYFGDLLAQLSLFFILLGKIEFQTIRIITTQIIITHLPRFEKSKPSVKTQRGFVDALSFKNYFAYSSLHSSDKLIKQFFAHLMSSVLFQNNQHSDICFFGVHGID